MPASSDFFGERSAQAVLKHGLLARYAHYFAGRAGAATRGKVAFIDGYAGEGRYRDGNPGSPLLLASEARRAKLFGRSVKLGLVEEDDTRRMRLRESLKENGIEPDQLLGEKLDDVVDALIDRYANHAVLIFVDPFGLGIKRTTLERILCRSCRTQPIDVIYHFSLSAVARMGRAGIANSAAGVSNAAQIEAALGVIRWRSEFRLATTPTAPTEAARVVARRFGKSVERSTGTRATAIEVRQRPGQLPRYLLMLLSANQQAHWDFADQAGKAYVDWLHHCDHEDYQANIEQVGGQGVFEIFEKAEPQLEDAEAQLRTMATAYLPGHLQLLLQENGVLRPIGQIPEIYGKMLGQARVTHLRAAFKALYDQGLIDDHCTGKFWDHNICWTGSR